VCIGRQQLVCPTDKGFIAVQMSRQLGYSASVVYKRLASENLRMHEKHSQLTDMELDSCTDELRQNHNNEVSH